MSKMCELNNRFEDLNKKINNIQLAFAFLNTSNNDCMGLTKSYYDICRIYEIAKNNKEDKEN